MDKKEEENEAQFELSDIEVISLGLVKHGANRQEFFLLKSEQEDIMSEEEKVNQGIDEQSLLEKLKGFFAPKIHEAVQEELAKQTEPNPDPEPEPPDTPEDQMATLQKAFDDRLKAIEKANKEKIEALAFELEKARDEREQREWLEKAQAMPAVPVKADELGEKLHQLAKANSELAGWFEATLRAVDAQLRDSGLYVEKGTSKEVDEPTNLVEKAEKLAEEKNIDFKDALLLVTADDSYVYLRQRRKEMREA